MSTPRDALPYVEYTTKAGTKDRIYADVEKVEDFKASSAITAHALEDGSLVSDHIRPEQITCSVELHFSETPTRGDLDDKLRGHVDSIALPAYKYPALTPLLSPKGVTDLVGSGVSAAASLVGLGGSSAPTHYTALKFDAAPGRGRLVFAKLMQLRTEGALVTLGLSFARLRNMALEEITIKRAYEDGADMVIALSCRQLSFVTTKSTAAVPLPVEPRAQTSKGNTVTVSVADVPDGADKTVLASIKAKALGR
jgi:hypothetical protein